MKYDSVIFDVDGTVFNTYSGIKRCVDYAVDRMGKPAIPPLEIRKFLGPALRDSFREVAGFTADEVETAVKLYREVYEGKEYFYDCEFFPGYPEIFATLKKAGFKLSVASSKPKKYLTMLFEKAGITHFFEKIEGPTEEEKHSGKKAVIEKAIVTKNCIMIGDRKFDIEGAKSVGIDSIAVTYGFGEREELDGCDPTFTADSTDDIIRILTSNLGAK